MFWSRLVDLAVCLIYMETSRSGRFPHHLCVCILINRLLDEMLGSVSTDYCLPCVVMRVKVPRSRDSAIARVVLVASSKLVAFRTFNLAFLCAWLDLIGIIPNRKFIWALHVGSRVVLSKLY